MKMYPMEKLITFPEEKAVRKYFDNENYKWFTRLLILFFGYAVWRMGQLSLDFGYSPFLTIGNGVLAGGVFLLFFLRKRPSVERNFHGLLVFWLAIQYILLIVFRESLESVSRWYFIYPYLLLVFRLRASGFFFLYGLILTTGAMDAWFPNEEQLTSLILGSVNGFICLMIALMVTALNKRKFLAVWRLERNNRERLRMKEELNQAREIQLSMLPPATPDLAHLHISPASIPASEVGGDYYDYFVLSPTKLNLVIGDVAGHGVASGLVLSGVRSCLYLMKENLPRPAELLGQLNRMLKKTTDKKMFMTFLCVEFDTSANQLILSSAGHPPLLYYNSREKTITEIKNTALPLGGILKAQYREVSVSFNTGDLFVFYTDGLVEARNPKGEEFGLKRVMRRLKSMVKHATPGKIREVLMTDVQIFMGDEEQLDDITLVIVRAV